MVTSAMWATLDLSRSDVARIAFSFPPGCVIVASRSLPWGSSRPSYTATAIFERKAVVVIGGGDTGTDCVATAIRQGAKSVVQLEFLPEPPEGGSVRSAWPAWPRVRKDDYGQLEAARVFGHDPRLWGTETLEFLSEGGSEGGRVSGLRVVSLDWSNGDPRRIAGSERVLDAQLVLVAMGFAGPEKDVLDALGARSNPKVFLAGDACTGPSLVVSAIASGLECATRLAEALGILR